MKSTGILRDEHKIMQQVLHVSEGEIASIRKTGEMKRIDLESMLDFLTAFVGRCHQAKEEKLLFVKIEERGMAEVSIPIAVMLHEHEEGKAMIGVIREAMQGTDSGEPAAAIADSLAVYVSFLFDHMDKEDKVLFPLADRLLTPSDHLALIEEFARIDIEELGEGGKDRYCRLVEKLASHSMLSG
jgi:hemerythrin-like domain-containing protein